jgi:DNA polymerase III sliding clamp (beta) subunit (PCNA family)
MKTTIETKQARTAVKFVAGVICRRQTLPILSNVLCTANGKLELSATDLDVTLAAACDAQTAHEGRVTIPGRALLDAVRGKNAIELETDEKRGVIFHDGANQTSVLTLSAEEFPPAVVVPENARRIIFDAETFIAALKTVSGAQSTDQKRYVLNGVCIELGADAVRLVATDGRRLHIAEIAGDTVDASTLRAIGQAEMAVTIADGELGNAKAKLAEVEKQFPPVYAPVTAEESSTAASAECADAEKVVADAAEVLETAKSVLAKLKNAVQILLPSDAVKHILRLPIDKKAPGTVLTLASWEAMARVECGVYSVTTKQIEGNFPNYRQAMPTAEDCLERVQVKNREFRDAVEVAQKATSEKSNSVRLTFSKNNLVISGNSPEIGEARAAVAINYKGKEFSIGFNPGYLLDACAAFSASDEMTLEMRDELCPLKILNNTGGTVVIMPMRLS